MVHGKIPCFHHFFSERTNARVSGSIEQHKVALFNCDVGGAYIVQT